MERTMTYEQLLAEAEPMLATKAEGTRKFYMRVLRYFDDFPCRASIVEKTNEWLEAGISARTVNNNHNAIRWAMKKFPRQFAPYDTQEAFNYMRDIKASKPKMSVATKEQAEKVIASTDERTALAVAFMFYHGLRISDVVALKLSNFSESEKGTVLDFVDEKTKQPHTYILIDRVVPLMRRYMNGQRRDIMAAWSPDKEQASEYLFVSRNGHLTQRSLQRIVVDTCKELGFPGLHPHSFRHGCATAYAKAGASAAVIQYALGHKSIASSQRYIHLNEDDLASVSKGVFG